MSETIKHTKPKAFYDTFERKGPGAKNTHYCPGCGHGTVHKLIAEAIDDLDIGERVIFCSPVGCSVFAYYYFDCGNIQCAHGRAPAVATGIRRCLDDAVVISYQGDGDLAGIGTGAIIHAANRGENISVFFINNAIYGMTGGQMAPTTLIGQQTMTTPSGRTVANEGHPIGMAETISSLRAPVYVERCSLGNPTKVLKTRKAIRKALKNQIDGKGFSMVEILAPCPVGWKMSSVDSREWLTNNLEPIFPVQVFRDDTDHASVSKEPETPPVSDDAIRTLFASTREDTWKPAPRDVPKTEQQIKVAGFGGQGVMSAGVLLANCAIVEDVNATWLPSYGPEMRGGTANASVIISEHVIGAPVVETPNVLIAMNGPSLDSFEEKMQPDGLVIVNSALIERKVERDDLRVIYIPATTIARDAGAIMTANIVAVTAYAMASGAIGLDTLRHVMPLSIKKKQLIDVNMKALDAAVEYMKEHYGDDIVGS